MVSAQPVFCRALPGVSFVTVLLVIQINVKGIISASSASSLGRSDPLSVTIPTFILSTYFLLFSITIIGRCAARKSVAIMLAFTIYYSVTILHQANGP